MFIGRMGVLAPAAGAPLPVPPGWTAKTNGKLSVHVTSPEGVGIYFAVSWIPGLDKDPNAFGQFKMRIPRVPPGRRAPWWMVSRRRLRSTPASTPGVTRRTP